MTTVSVQRFAEAWKKLVPNQAMPASRGEAKQILDGLDAKEAAPALALLTRVDDGAYRDMLDGGAAHRTRAKTMLAGDGEGAVGDEARRAAQTASGKPPAKEGATARRGAGMQVAYVNGSMKMPMPIEPPPFPSAADLKAKKDTSMPKAAVDMVKGMKTGEMHAQWHTTRDFAFTMQELDSSDPKNKAVLSAWQSLRDAKLGVPEAKSQKGTHVDPKQQAFIDAMNAFATANAKSKDENIADVVSTWKEIQKQNWPIPAREEGDAGNGLDFLAMHHEMVLMMKNMIDTKKMSPADQQTMQCLNGWTHFPTPAPWPYDAADSTAGVAKATNAVNMLNALLSVDAKSATAVAAFKQQFEQTTGVAFDSATPDQFGLWIQSSAAGMPNSGVHNWMHNEYEVPNSKTEMDSFVLNVQNPHFWGLHGTIDNAFMKFLSLRGMTVNDPTVKAALKEQAAEMGMQVQPEHGGHMPMKGGMKGMPGSDLPSYDDMSKGLKDVIALAQKHAVSRGTME